MENLSYEERVREMALFSLEKKQLQGNVAVAFQDMKRTIREVEREFLQRHVMIG